MLTPVSVLPQLKTRVRDAANANGGMANIAMPAAFANADVDARVDACVVICCVIERPLRLVNLNQVLYLADILIFMTVSVLFASAYFTMELFELVLTGKGISHAYSKKAKRRESQTSILRSLTKR
jgi:hypothetical protein